MPVALRVRGHVPPLPWRPVRPLYLRAPGIASRSFGLAATGLKSHRPIQGRARAGTCKRPDPGLAPGAGARFLRHRLAGSTGVRGQFRSPDKATGRTRELHTHNIHRTCRYPPGRAGTWRVAPGGAGQATAGKERGVHAGCGTGRRRGWRGSLSRLPKPPSTRCAPARIPSLQGSGLCAQGSGLGPQSSGLGLQSSGLCAQARKPCAQSPGPRAQGRKPCDAACSVSSAKFEALRSKFRALRARQKALRAGLGTLRARQEALRSELGTVRARQKALRLERRARHAAPPGLRPRHAGRWSPCSCR